MKEKIISGQRRLKSWKLDSIALFFMLLLAINPAFVSAANPGHGAAAISAGTFASGDFRFPASVLITTNLDVLGGWLNTTSLCIADSCIDSWDDVNLSASGAGGHTGDQPYLYNDTDTMYLNETKLNATIDARADADTDTDTNASTICGDNEVLLGQDTTLCVNLNTTIDARSVDSIPYQSTAAGWSNTSSTTTTSYDVTVNGGAVFNEASADKDFRVESNNNANMFLVDAGTDAVLIGTNDISTYQSSLRVYKQMSTAATFGYDAAGYFKNSYKYSDNDVMFFSGISVESEVPSSHTSDVSNLFMRGISVKSYSQGTYSPLDNIGLDVQARHYTDKNTSRLTGLASQSGIHGNGTINLLQGITSSATVTASSKKNVHSNVSLGIQNRVSVATFSTKNSASIKNAYGYYGTMEAYELAGNPENMSATIDNSYFIYLTKVVYPNYDVGVYHNVSGLYMEDMDFGDQNSYAIYTNAGKVRFGDNVTVVGNVNATSLCIADSCIDSWDDVNLSASGAGGHTGDQPYLYNDTDTMYLNETKLNATIDARSVDSIPYQSNASGWGNTSTTTSTGLDVNVNSGTFFVNATSNKVGMGTVTPTQKLDISDGTRAITFAPSANALINTTASANLTITSSGGSVIIRLGG